MSVVVLDEVGLAEDSPNLPLKALHPLLEDGTVGADREAGSEEHMDYEACTCTNKNTLQPMKDVGIAVPNTYYTICRDVNE